MRRLFFYPGIRSGRLPSRAAGISGCLAPDGAGGVALSQ